MPSEVLETGAPGSEKQTEVIPAWVGIGRAVGGAIIFSLPMMMTMEMWWIGFYIKPARLVLLVLFSLPLFISISSMIGFKESKGLWDNVVDVLVAYAVTFVATGIALIVFGAITWETALEEAYSMILLQSVPGALGALLARSVVGPGTVEADDRSQNYGQEMVVLLTGGLFLAFNLAPTEEMVLISYMMSSWHMLALMLLTLVVMHFFTVSTMDGPADNFKNWKSQARLFIRFTSTGYVLSFALSVFMLWVFGRADSESFGNFVNTAVVLSFPTGVGAAAARVIL